VALDWTREEEILALAVYIEFGSHVNGKIPDTTHAATQELSDTLRRLSAHPAEKQNASYRSVNSVRLKLANFLAAQNNRQGMGNNSQMDIAIWREFSGKWNALAAEAAAIRAGMDSGDIQPARLDMVTAEQPIAAEIAIEQHNTGSFDVSPSGDPRTGTRAEAPLVRAYCDHMKAQGIQVCRMMYRPAGEVSPLYCDAWVKDRNLLIEAKHSHARDALRQAIGQLYDYRRFHAPLPSLAVLLPYRPAGDRSDLLSSVGVAAIWPSRKGTGFEDTGGGAFVLAGGVSACFYLVDDLQAVLWPGPARLALAWQNSPAHVCHPGGPDALAECRAGAERGGEGLPGGGRYAEDRAVAVVLRVADQDHAGGVAGLDAVRATVAAIARLAPRDPAHLDALRAAVAGLAPA
jgi:hypothetical protein